MHFALISETCIRRLFKGGLLCFFIFLGLSGTLSAQSSHLQAYAKEMKEAETLLDQGRNAEGIQAARLIAARVVAEKAPSSDKALSEIQMWLGHRYMSIGHYQEAEHSYSSALNHRQQFQKDEVLPQAEAHFALSLTFLQSGMASRAETELKTAMEFQSQAGIGLPYCKSLEQLAGLQLLRGQDADAEIHYLRLSHLHDSLEGPMSTSLARTLNNLGGVYAGRGFEERAKGAYEQALNIQQQTGNQIELSTTLTNLGVLYDGLDEYEKSLDYLQKAFKIRKENLPPADPMFLTSLDNLVGLMVKNQKYEAVQALLQQTKREREQRFGGDSPLVAEILDRFATFALAREQGNVALAYFQEALKIRENSLGSQSPQLAANLYNLGKLENLLSKTEQARIHLNWGLDIYEYQTIGNESQVTAILSELFVCDFIQGKLDAAEKDLDLMRAIKSEVYGPSHPETLAVMEELANFYRNSRRPDEAELVESDILRLRSQK